MKLVTYTSIYSLFLSGFYEIKQSDRLSGMPGMWTRDSKWCKHGNTKKLL